MKRKVLAVGGRETFEAALALLEGMGCQARWVPSGEKAVGVLVSFKPDLLIVESGLPGISGLSLMELARKDAAVNEGLRAMVVAEDRRPEALVEAFERGADDFLAKPFDPRELAARVEVLFRRSSRSLDSDRIRCGGIVIEPATRRAEADGRPVRLTRTEFSLLHLLIQKAGRALSRDYILHYLWGAPSAGPTRTVDMHMANLRRKLGAQAARIETVPGLGYLFRKEG